MLIVVIVRSCTFTNNQGRGFGGGVSVSWDSSLVINNSTFTNNMANAAGGGVFVSYYSKLDISRSLFDGNVANLDGGAVFVAENCSVICTSSNFFNNQATIRGGAISVVASNATLSNLVLEQNHGRCALSFTGNQYTSTYNSIFSKNTDRAMCTLATIESTVWNCDFLGNEGDTGAAISVDYSQLVTVANVRFVYNVAKNTGGAISMMYSNIIIDSSTFEDNAAFFDGGAIFILSGNVSVENSYFINNIAERGFGGVVSIGPGRLTMSNCSAKHNYAYTGGVIYGTECAVNLTHCTFENNTAVGNGGAVYIRDTDALD